MCIRDSGRSEELDRVDVVAVEHLHLREEDEETERDEQIDDCLLYTSDAADERSSVDLGGRRIIKKKKYEKM